MLFTNLTCDKYAKDPAVVHFNGSYYLYHSALNRASGKLGIGIARSDNAEDWTLIGFVPLEQPCEARGIGAPAAIVLSGAVHLFYQTYGNREHDAICHATSPDGVHFVKNPANPVFSPAGDWCCGRAIDADVCLFNGKLFLYYATRDKDFVKQLVGGAFADPESDFSRSAWTELDLKPLLSPELPWEGACIEAPATVVNNGRMFMFYGGSYNCTPQQIGAAVSDDGEHFTRLSDLPFIPCGKPGDWNSSESGHPYAFRDDNGDCILFYQGSCDNGRTWYLSRADLAFDENNIPYVACEKSR